LIGCAAGILLWFNGRIAGISGIINGAMEASAHERTWRGLFLLGLIAGAFAYSIANPGDFALRTDLAWPILAVAGFFVGFGTRMGGGCTSGHGVCGISRLSARSIIATVTFIATGILTTAIVRHVLGLPT
jgi:uncharacterized membrane protein YedE/YeeE